MIEATMIDRQLALEEEMFRQGKTRYDNQAIRSKEREDEASTKHGRFMMRRMITPIEEGIRDFIAHASSGVAGRRHVAVKYLADLDPSVLAFITARVALNAAARHNAKLVKVAVALGRAVEFEARLNTFEQASRPLFNRVRLDLQSRTSNRAWHRKVMLHAMNKYEIDFEAWPERSLLLVGTALLDILITNTGLFYREVRWEKKTKSSLFITPHQLLADEMCKQATRFSMLAPHYYPMVVPPKDWEGPWGGGYLQMPHPLPIMTGRSQRWLEELSGMENQLADVYDAINTVQSVPWRVNASVLDVAIAAWEQGSGLGKLPLADPLPVPPKPFDIATNDTARAEYRTQAAAVHLTNSKMTSKRLQCSQILGLARKFRDDAALYFPHQLDFRGRLYPLPNYLNPQGTDFAKGLLTFAEGKTINDGVAAGWLMIHGANCFGVDKVSFDDRIDWVDENTNAILAVAADPLNNRMWCDADKPWQFLAWCFEYAGFQAEGFGFVSSLPVALDGSCNGLQHFSAMLHDEEGGRAVNLLPTEVPEDIYQRVADRVTNNLEELIARMDVCHCGGSLSTGSSCMARDGVSCSCTAMATEDDEAAAKMAERWLAFGVTRKLTKRPVMIVPYSGTLHAARKYIEEYLRERIEEGSDTFAFEEVREASNFIAPIVWAAIGDTVIAARDAMAWLRTVAKVTAKAQLPIQWVTPDGLLVQQDYHETSSTRVKTKMGDTIIKLSILTEKDGLDSKQQQAGISPNLVHSMDACALRMYTLIARDNGVTAFSLVHDSYGTLAADTEMSMRCLRHAFVNMYEEDILLQIRNTVLSYLPEELHDEIPPLPPKGSLDINLVRQADYFFA